MSPPRSSSPPIPLAIIAPPSSSMPYPLTKNTTPGTLSLSVPWGLEALQQLAQWRPPPITGQKWEDHPPSGDQSQPPGDGQNPQNPPFPEVNFLRLLLKAQHNSIVQAHNDRAAAAERMARIKEASTESIS
ncbi:hypothetical protein PCASD_09408 [Puccinia coronata f. sp. avenae]|uniref:Uncharacterized protein n=1 Tax=Puccinia coronata f. sp. avenae TaxID=200324 RepID=A0A2N5UHQ2_9BASI|nr:hypothetical protein PCASD_09408 [Puccinia coronata f. sp. avenae]